MTPEYELAEARDLVQELTTRLRAAETALVIQGRTGTSTPTVRGKAALQAWLDWSQVYGDQAPEVTDEQTIDLANRRDEIRERTLARFRGEA